MECENIFPNVIAFWDFKLGLGQKQFATLVREFMGIIVPMGAEMLKRILFWWFLICCALFLLLHNAFAAGLFWYLCAILACYAVREDYARRFQNVGEANMTGLKKAFLRAYRVHRFLLIGPDLLESVVAILGVLFAADTGASSAASGTSSEYSSMQDWLRNEHVNHIGHIRDVTGIYQDELRKLTAVADEFGFDMDKFRVLLVIRTLENGPRDSEFNIPRNWSRGPGYEGQARFACEVIKRHWRNDGFIYNVIDMWLIERDKAQGKRIGNSIPSERRDYYTKAKDLYDWRLKFHGI